MNFRVAHGPGGAKKLTSHSGPIIVIDALRMSATVIVALQLGMEVVPVATEKEALALKKGGAITAGERGGKRLPRLDLGNSPSELLRLGGEKLPGKEIVLTTSNGVPALLAVAKHPGPVLVGSPLNLTSLAEWIKGKGPRGLFFLLAGREDEDPQEDAMSASLLLNRLEVQIPKELPNPIPASKLDEWFLNTDSGRRLSALGYEEDIHLCARVDSYPIVPIFRDGRIVRCI
jgi:2-phosphosulfolactate phosphatase